MDNSRSTFAHTTIVEPWHQLFRLTDPPTASPPERPDTSKLSEMRWTKNVGAVKKMHWARSDSNREPRDYESPALTVELRARVTRLYRAKVDEQRKRQRGARVR